MKFQGASQIPPVLVLYHEQFVESFIQQTYFTERGNRVAKNWGYRQEHPMNRPAGVHLLRQDEIEVNHTVENHVSEIGESSMGGKLVTYPSLTVRIHASILLENPPKQDLTVQTHHSNNKPHIKKDRKRPRENIDNSSHSEKTVNQSRKKKKSKKERHFKCDQARLGRIITSKK